MRFRHWVLMFITLGFAATASAVDWVGADGDFLEGANWSSGEAPFLDEPAVINNGGTATLSGDLAEASKLEVGISGGSGNYVQTGGDFAAAGAFIGSSGTGSATISGGTFEIGGDSIHVGWLPAGVGTMTIDSADAYVKSGDDFQLGREGTGTLNLSAGELSAGYTVVGKFGTGIWNQTGGYFNQAFGDVEIGDGGRDDQEGTAGPRSGQFNLSDGFVYSTGNFAIGNRRGSGEVNVSGGVLAVTGNANSTIFVGRGADSSPGVGGPTSLRVTGGDSTIVATGNFSMNPDSVSSQSTLIAEITGTSHTPILVSGDADISNGHLKVELNGYSPVADDSWVLIQTGLELDDVLASIDSSIEDAGYVAPTHGFPAVFGTVLGEFLSVDTSAATLAPGLDWEVLYQDETVLLSVTGTAGLFGDFDGSGTLDAADIDILSNAVQTGSTNSQYDVNTDGNVDAADREAWIVDVRKTYYGDSNLDGEFSSADFVAVFTAGQYEDAVADNSTWATGDWNGDGEFDSSDFVAAFTAGGYELGPKAAVSAVPEPSSWVLLLLSTLPLLSLRKR
ncbi:MAG: hypothetical protein R3C28_02795 [Pirellulaceae bacterium]